MKVEDAHSLIRDWFDDIGVDVSTLDASQQQLLSSLKSRLVDGLPVTLPSVGSLGTGYWCAAKNPNSLRRFREDVDAFLGPTYAVIEVGDRSLDPASSQGRLLTKHGYVHCFRVLRPSSVPANILRQRVQFMLASLAQGPAVELSAPPGLGYLLRDLEWALAAADDEGIESAYESLRQLGQLSEDNIRFIEVRKYAALEQWDRLWSSGLIPYLMAIPRPQAVTDLLLEAVWHGVLLPAVEVAEAQTLVEAFKATVADSYAPLFTSAQHVATPTAKRMAMLFALTQDPVRDDVIAAILSHGSVGGIGADQLMADLMTLAPREAPTRSRPLLDRAAEALGNAEYDLALSLLDDESPASVRGVEMMVAAAFELPDLEPAVKAMRAFATLSEDQRAAMTSSPQIARRLKALADVAGAVLTVSDKVPESWAQWLDVLVSNPSWTGAAESARAGVSEWPIGSEAELTELSTQFLEAFGTSRDAIALAMPHLAAFAIRVDEERGEAAAFPLWRAMFEILVLDDRASASDLEAAVDLLSRLLQTTPPATAYREIIEDAVGLWTNRLASYEHLDWALEAVDALARNACPDLEARLRFLAQVAGTLQAVSHRLRTADHAYAGLLFAECGHGDLLLAMSPAYDAEPTVEASKWRALDGKRLGLHCLFEPIVRRFVELMSRLAARAEVEVDKSHDCSPHLQALCQSSDILVVVTQHAKHAATQCIERHAMPPTVVVKPRRARIGSTGVIQALEDYVDGLARADDAA